MFNINQIFSAPLAGITDKPFRRIIRRYAQNASLITEMISCHSIVASAKNCPRNFDDLSDEGAIGAQIFGNDPELMGRAAAILADAGAKWIDINMGCPVAKVATRSGSGAHLMRDHALSAKIITAVVRGSGIPVSIKTRLGWDDDTINWADLVKIAGDCGAAFATLHGRTRAAGYFGPANLPIVPDGLIPVIGNGDIKTSDDVSRVLALGYAGAMVGRGLYGRPWVIGQLTGELKSPPTNICEIVLEHLEMVLEYYGAKIAIPLFRKHIAWYSNGMPNAAEFRTKINQINDENSLKLAIRQFWGCFDNSEIL